MEAEIWGAHVAAAPPIAGGIRTGVVFVDAHERTVRRIGWTVPGVVTLDLAAFRGIVYALWNARRLGPRRVIVYCDNPSVVAQINGCQDVDPALVGPYLEVRALLHAYRSARVEVQGTRWGRFQGLHPFRKAPKSPRTMRGKIGIGVLGSVDACPSVADHGDSQSARRGRRLRR